MSVLLDTARRFETPEGVDLTLRIAGPVPRAVAWCIDLAIRAVAYLVLGFVLGLLGGLGVGLSLLLLFLAEWFYPVVFEARRGATPGKQALGLAVVHDDGAPLTWSSSMVRNLLRAVDFLPVGYGLGLACMLVNRDFKRLGDLAAGTLVVYREDAPTDSGDFEGDLLAPPGSLTVAEQSTLLAFAERAGALTPERRVELAEVLSPLTGKRGDAAVSTLLGYANWVARGR